ncbi:hypothetical protein ACP70R_030726 [Stipagrostis hirtigluma subsp. patula]
MCAVGRQCAIETRHDDLPVPAEELELQQPVARRQPTEREMRVDDRNINLLDLLERNLTAENHFQLVAVTVLHMVRCREFTEYNHKRYLTVHTRFCRFNIGLFDLDKESTIQRGPSSTTINESNVWSLNDSINVISVNVVESDVDYPINIYGTVLARDECDYRCVYLFKRSRDDPQLISSPDDTLTLTGPYRALTVTDSMFFEFHLKIKCDGEVDKDFSKGLLEHMAVRYRRQPMILSLASRLSTVDIVYTPVLFAAEASLEALILKGTSNFTGKVTAWTSGNDKNKIVLYDNAVACSQKNLGNDGSVPLTRRIVAVPVDEYLVLDVFVSEGDHGANSLQLILGNEEEECSVTQGPYELQVKIIWTAVTRRHPTKMWQKIEDDRVLCSE